jgi:hypothetical protein
VYFTWKILDWKLPKDVRVRMDLNYEEAVEDGPGVSMRDTSPGG